MADEAKLLELKSKLKKMMGKAGKASEGQKKAAAGVDESVAKLAPRSFDALMAEKRAGKREAAAGGKQLRKGKKKRVLQARGTPEAKSGESADASSSSSPVSKVKKESPAKAEETQSAGRTTRLQAERMKQAQKVDENEENKTSGVATNSPDRAALIREKRRAAIEEKKRKYEEERRKFREAQAKKIRLLEQEQKAKAEAARQQEAEAVVEVAKPSTSEKKPENTSQKALKAHLNAEAAAFVPSTQQSTSEEPESMVVEDSNVLEESPKVDAMDTSDEIPVNESIPESEPAAESLPSETPVISAPSQNEPVKTPSQQIPVAPPVPSVRRTVPVTHVDTANSQGSASVKVPATIAQAEEVLEEFRQQFASVISQFPATLPAQLGKFKAEDFSQFLVEQLQPAFQPSA